jgi:uncharacterized membrane protein YqhA
MKQIESFFEGLLWNSRMLIGIAVFASMVVAVIMFYIATVDVVFLLGEVLRYAQLAAQEREKLHGMIVGNVAEIVDGYLFATIMIIFALGLYELFISKIDIAESSPIAGRLLLIRSLDDLKERLAKVVFLILIVRYFEYALRSSTPDSLDLLYLAVGIALIALSLSLTGRVGHDGEDTEHRARGTESVRGSE